MEVETNETESQLPQFDKTLLEVQSLRTKFLNIKNASKGEDQYQHYLFNICPTEKEVALAIKTCNQLLKLYKEASEMFFKDESEMTQTPPSLNEKRNDTMKLRDKRSTSNETLKSKKRKRASSSATMTTTPTPTIITTTTSSSSSPLEDRAPYSPPTTKAKHVPVKNPARRTTTTGSTISTDATLGSDDEDELQPDRLVATKHLITWRHRLQKSRDHNSGYWPEWFATSETKTSTKLRMKTLEKMRTTLSASIIYFLPYMLSHFLRGI